MAFKVKRTAAQGFANSGVNSPEQAEAEPLPHPFCSCWAKNKGECRGDEVPSAGVWGAPSFSTQIPLKDAEPVKGGIACSVE